VAEAAAAEAVAEVAAVAHVVVAEVQEAGDN